MTIFEIDARISEILLMTDEETGELPEQAFAMLDQLIEDRDMKIDNAACMTLDLLADARKIREEELALAERRKSLEKRAERIKKYLEYATQGEPFSSPRVQIKYRRSQAIDIDDGVFWAWAADHPEYARRKDPEPDKTAIKAALKAGNVIPGAELVDRTFMTIK